MNYKTYTKCKHCGKPVKFSSWCECDAAQEEFRQLKEYLHGNKKRRLPTPNK